jgi:hypothetical protein
MDVFNTYKYVRMIPEEKFYQLNNWESLVLADSKKDSPMKDKIREEANKLKPEPDDK